MKPETASLARRSTRSAVRSLLGQAVLLLGAHGSLDYWQAWLYLSITLLSTLGTTVYLLRNDPALLRRRLAMEEIGERERVHKLFLLGVLGCGSALFVVSALDHRYAWSSVPPSLQLLGFVLYCTGIVVVFATFRANSFGSSIVTVEAEQRVCSTGPYRLLRHPMYGGMLLGTFATPLCLGSYWGLLLFAPTCALFVVRLRAEERLLRAELRGYTDYAVRTPWRLVPGVW